MHIKKEYLLLAACIILAALIRFYRMEELAVFLADQASDSTKVHNILQGDPTLLGPITSVGGFYNGPIVYYLMLPFYWVFKSAAISGTLFQTTFSLATIPFLYLLGKRIQNTRVGLIAAYLFAISPLMIEYSRAAFNAYPAIFFSTFILYLLMSLEGRFRYLRYALLGVSIGWIIQMHYLTTAFVFLALVFPFLSFYTIHKIPYYFLVISGIIAGLSPFILFELTHDFLNTHLLLQYFSTPSSTPRSFIEAFAIWPRLTGALLLGNNVLLGRFGFLGILALLIMLLKKRRQMRQHLAPFGLLCVLVFLIGLLYGRYLHTHYVISLHTTFLLLAALAINSILNDKKVGYGILGIILLVVNAPAWNIHQDKHPLQDGLNIPDFEHAAALIDQDKKGTYNVAMHAQGDNRAMPLRYALLLKDEHPEPYENYTAIEHLYFLVKKEEPIKSQVMWEYTAFGPSQVIQTWDVNEEYLLYKLAKE